MSRKGFTLIELIVVIAILAILAVALIPLISSFIEKSRVSRFLSEAAAVEAGGIAFQADTGLLPDRQQVTFVKQSELFENINDLTTWNGPYLSNNLAGINPWGGPFLLGYFNITGDLRREWFLALFAQGGIVPPGFENLGETSIGESSLELIDTQADGQVNTNEGRFQGDGSGFFVLITMFDALSEEQFEE